MYHCYVPGFTGTATDDVGVVRVTMHYYGLGPDDEIEYEIDYDPATHQFSGLFCGVDYPLVPTSPIKFCNDLGLDGWCTKAPIPADGTYLNHLHGCPYDPNWCKNSYCHGAQIRAYDAEGNYGYDTFNVDVDTCPDCPNEKPYVCSAKCVDLATDPNNCGSCGNACGANAYCSSGTCQCNSGYGNCDGDWSNGCEANLNTDPNNCGSCGNACDPGVTCKDGECEEWAEGCCKIPSGCIGGYLYVPGCKEIGGSFYMGQVCCPDGDCHDLNTDPNNCGSCGNACGANAHCSGGACQCDEGYGNCDGDWSNGCEVNLNTDPNNCGSCDNACGANAYCSSGTCQCNSGYGNCDGDWSNGCEVNLNTDPNNCGSCGNACDEDYWDCVDSSTVGLYHCTCVDGSPYWEVIDTYDCLEGEECVDGECQEVPEFPAGVTAVFGTSMLMFFIMRRKHIEK
ncbi:hypothetical protein C5S53_08245 [Methanophagales archaeon]|nr:hypothetical protein C5S53_08245 [Methanophagales archaeon]